MPATQRHRQILIAFLVSVLIGICFVAAAKASSGDGCGTEEECYAIIWSPSFCDLVPAYSYWWYAAYCDLRGYGRIAGLEVNEQPDGSVVTALILDTEHGRARIVRYIAPRHRQ